MKKLLYSFNFYILLSATLGIVTGFFFPVLFGPAQLVSDGIMSLLRLISMPLIFLSVVATISGMQNLEEMKNLARKVLQYTLSTTIIAAVIALVLYVIIRPARGISLLIEHKECAEFEGYFAVVCKMLPTNIIQPFTDNNVVGIMLIALALSFAILTLPQENKQILHQFFASFFAALLKITELILFFIPLATWAFTTLFIKSIMGESSAALSSIFWYFMCIMLANAIQGFIALPIFLKLHNIPPLKVFKGMLPALTVAFFSRSSNSTLPMTIKCAEQNVHINPRIARFTLPLCATINMNGCAAFILTTVLFVGQSNGMVFSLMDMVLWVFIATIVAIGNAGVPMGCYFLAGALLATMNVPLQILGVILPFYAIIDMFETALNVWSDSVIAALVNTKD